MSDQGRIMNDSTHRYRRFSKARERIAAARDRARHEAEQERINPPLFDLREIEEGDR